MAEVELDPVTYEEVEADRSATGQAMLVVVLSSVGAGIGARGLGSLGRSDEDRRVAADAIRTTRRLMQQKALAPYRPEEFLPGPSVGDDDASLVDLVAVVEQATRRLAGTVPHPGARHDGHGRRVRRLVLAHDPQRLGARGQELDRPDHDAGEGVAALAAEPRGSRSLASCGRSFASVSRPLACASFTMTPSPSACARAR